MAVNAAIVAVVLVMAVMMLSLQKAEGKNYTVGGTVGWRTPPNGATTYSDWATNISFQTGDILVFNFVTGSHDVAVVTKEDYDACNTATPVDQYSASPASYSLDVSGDYSFICTKGGGASHCLSGQKLQITVADPPASGPTVSSLSPSSSPLPKNNTSGAVSKYNKGSRSVLTLIFTVAMCYIIYT